MTASTYGLPARLRFHNHSVTKVFLILKSGKIIIRIFWLVFKIFKTLRCHLEDDTKLITFIL